MAQRLAEFTLATRWDDVEAKVRHEVKRSFLNWLGCAIGGSQHESIAIAEKAMLPVAGAGQSTIIGRGKRSDMLTASLLNCTSSSVDAFDDTHAETILHPTGPVATALLALAEARPMSGRDFQIAMLLGFDIESRLSKALAVPPAKCKVGWYLTGLTGGVGAAASIGRALGLSPEQVVWAMGIASGQGAGNRSMHAALTSAMVPGHAAQSGLRSALLAQAGFTCGANFIEHPNGFLALFGEPGNPDALFSELGRRYEVMANNYKPWPCGIVLHAMVDACLKLRREPGFAAGDIAKIEAGVHQTAITLGNRRHPKDDLEAIVSLHHWAAAVLSTGSSGIEVNKLPMVKDAAITALRDRVHPVAAPGMAPDAATVTVTNGAGKTWSAEIDHCLGSATRPMSDRDLEDKFRGLCKGVVDPPRAERLIAACWGLDELADVGEIARLAA
jgi:2-methylcitrate dehydratase PrpD